MAVRTLQFLAVVISALALVPSGAHLAALPNKIDLPQAEYFAAQDIYNGWAILGLLWPAALAANASLAFATRSQPRSFWFATLAAICFALMLAIFFAWTFPANQVTENWTSVPDGWQTLRQQWEYSHAANAGFAFVALSLTTLSILSWRRGATLS